MTGEFSKRWRETNQARLPPDVCAVGPMTGSSQHGAELFLSSRAIFLESFKQSEQFADLKRRANQGWASLSSQHFS